MGLTSWLNRQLLSEELFELRKKKYGWVHYLFQISLVNSVYATMPTLLLYIFSLMVMLLILIYHVYCYAMTMFEAYAIGRFDILVANVHSIVLAIYVCCVTVSYFLVNDRTKEIEAKFDERLFMYEYEEPVEPTTFEKVTDQIGRHGLAPGGVLLFMSVYVIAPLLDLRILEQDCVKRGINFCIPLPMYHPYESGEGWKYIMSYIIQTWFGFYRVCVFVAVQMTTAKWVLHLTRELSILKKSLQIFDVRVEKKFFQRTKQELTQQTRSMMYNDKEFNYCAKSCLKESVKHHHNILKHHANIDETLEMPSFLAYMTCMMAVGIAMVKLLTVDDKTTFGANVAYCAVLGAEVCSIFVLSMIGENLTSVGDDIYDIVSHTPIHNYDLEFRKSLLLFMLGTQRSLAMSSSKFSKCNHEAFGNVLNVSYSFYNVTNASRDK